MLLDYLEVGAVTSFEVDGAEGLLLDAEEGVGDGLLLFADWNFVNDCLGGGFWGLGLRVIMVMLVDDLM